MISRPIAPMPTTPSLRPSSSKMPPALRISQFPRSISDCCWGRSFASANSIAAACSATERLFAPGVITTGMPFSVAFRTSTVSYPTPVRPITFRFGLCSITFASQEATRTTSASASAIRSRYLFGSGSFAT